MAVVGLTDLRYQRRCLVVDPGGYRSQTSEQYSADQGLGRPNFDCKL